MLEITVQTAKARRKCVTCKSPIPAGSLCLAEEIGTGFGVCTQSRCAACATPLLAEIITKARRARVMLAAAVPRAA